MLKLVSVLPISFTPSSLLERCLIGHSCFAERLIFFLPAALWTLLELLSMTLIFLLSKKLEECKKKQ